MIANLNIQQRPLLLRAGRGIELSLRGDSSGKLLRAVVRSGVGGWGCGQQRRTGEAACGRRAGRRRGRNGGGVGSRRHHWWAAATVGVVRG